jgi:hypothetical protein
MALLERKPKTRFAFFYVPAAIDESTRLSHFIRSTPIWGGLYYGTFRYLIGRLLHPQTTKPSWPISGGGLALTLVFVAIMALIFAIIFGR